MCEPDGLGLAEIGGLELIDAGHAKKAHSRDDLGFEKLEHAHQTFFPRGAKPPSLKLADGHRLRAEGKRL